MSRVSEVHVQARAVTEVSRLELVSRVTEVSRLEQASRVS